MSKKWPTICVDFDGVIHSYTTKWVAEHIISDKPVPGAFLALEEYIDAGMHVCIYSSRSRSSQGLTAMRKWMANYALSHFDHDLVKAQKFMSNLDFPEFKPPAMLYIDDRGYHFKGDFPSVDFIKTFKPWNK